MCERVVQIIPGLLNPMNNLQDQVHWGLNSMNNLQAQLHNKSVEAGRVKKMLDLSWLFFVIYIVLSKEDCNARSLVEVAENHLQPENQFESENHLQASLQSENNYGEDTAYLCLHFTKDYEGNKINTLYPDNPIRRIQVIECEDSGRYQMWSILQEIPNTPLIPSGAATEWFKKDCIGSVTTWEDLVEKFVQKFYQLSDNNEEMETDEDDDPNDIADIFKIEGNLFDFETPLCKAFIKFNYLLKIDTDLFTFDIQEIKTCEEYELSNNTTGDLEEPWLNNGVPYQLCDNICEPYHFKNGKTKWTTCSSDVDGFCNGGELPGMNIGGRNHGENNAGNTQDNKKEHHDPSICNIRRFEMMKYSFDADDEYVTIKERDHSDHSRTNVDACQAYQEFFRIMEEGWLMTMAKEE
ncbi:hypothetical protein Tco_0031007 [Tanacetum coccineum]